MCRKRKNRSYSGPSQAEMASAFRVEKISEVPLTVRARSESPTPALASEGAPVDP